MTSRQNIAMQWSLLAIVVGFALMLLTAPGTPDTTTYTKWVDGANELGLLGYYAEYFDYPPGTLTIFWIFDLVIPGGSFIAVKTALLVFLLGTAALVGLWQRSVNATTVTLAALVVGAMGLGYADILVAPFLVGSLWLLSRDRFVFAGLLFAIACAVKWQPLIFIPFVVIYIAGMYVHVAGRWKRRVVALVKLAIPAAVVALLTIVIYGYWPIWASFTRAFTPSMLSGNTLNFEWVLTWVSLGGSDRVHWQYLDEVAAWMPLIGRAIMMLLLVATIIVFIFSKRTFDQLLLAGASGLLVYFVWNINVHENHLFLAALLAVVLSFRVSELRLAAVVLIAAHNINMVIMYGLAGTVDTGSRLIGTLDTTVPYSILVCAVSLVFLWVSASFLLRESRPRTLRDAWVSALR